MKFIKESKRVGACIGLWYDVKRNEYVTILFGVAGVGRPMPCGIFSDRAAADLYLSSCF
jgi:hypothetical protein